MVKLNNCGFGKGLSGHRLYQIEICCFERASHREIVHIKTLRENNRFYRMMGAFILGCANHMDA